MIYQVRVLITDNDTDGTSMEPPAVSVDVPFIGSQLLHKSARNISCGRLGICRGLGGLRMVHITSSRVLHDTGQVHRVLKSLYILSLGRHCRLTLSSICLPKLLVSWHVPLRDKSR